MALSALSLWIVMLAMQISSQHPVMLPAMVAMMIGSYGATLLWCTVILITALALNIHTQPRALGVSLGICGMLLVLNGLSPSANSLMPIPQAIRPVALAGFSAFLLGYAALAVTCALTLAAVIEHAPTTWSDRVRPWLLLAWLALTVGNLLVHVDASLPTAWGAPVCDAGDNASLVPWVLCLASLQGLWLTYSARHWLWPATLCVGATWCATLYGIQFAQRGILPGMTWPSVAPWRGYMPLVLSVGVGSALLLWHGRRWRLAHVRSQHCPDRSSIAWGIAAVVALAAVLLARQPSPVWQTPLSFHGSLALMMPFAASSLALLAWPGLRRLGRPIGQICASLVGLIIVAAGFVFVTVGITAVDPLWQYWHWGCAPFLLAAAGAVIWTMGRQLRRPSLRLENRGTALTYLGLAVLVVGMVIAGYGTHTTNTYVSLVTPHRFSNLQIEMTWVRPTIDDRFGALVSINAQPYMIMTREYRGAQQPYIRWIGHRWWGDQLVIPMELNPTPHVDADGKLLPSGGVIAVITRPGTPLIWGGLALMILGMTLSFIRHASIRRTIEEETVIRRAMVHV